MQSYPALTLPQVWLFLAVFWCLKGEWLWSCQPLHPIQGILSAVSLPHEVIKESWSNNQLKLNKGAWPLTLAVLTESSAFHKSKRANFHTSVPNDLRMTQRWPWGTYNKISIYSAYVAWNVITFAIWNYELKVAFQIHAQNDLKVTLMGLKVPYMPCIMYAHTQVQNFHLFWSPGFWSTCTVNMVNGFICFDLNVQWMVSEIQVNFQTNTPNDPKMTFMSLRLKALHVQWHNSEAQSFIHFAL